MLNQKKDILSNKAAPSPTIEESLPAYEGYQIKNTEKDFDPHEYGCVDGIGRWGASVHIVRTTIGIGILLMPYVMKNLGYITGTVLMLSVTFIYYHTVHILLSVEYRLCKMLQVHHLSFIGVAEEVFSNAPFPINKVRLVVLSLIYFYYGVPVGNVTFLIVIATNVQQMAKYFGQNLQPTFIMTILIAPFTIFCMYRKLLKILVPYSSITNICTILMIAIVIGFSVVQPQMTDSPQAFGDIFFIPQGLATFILAIRCTGIIIPLKNDMSCPQQLSTFNGSLNISGLFIALLYIGFGLIPYLNFANSVQENILLNIPANNTMAFLIYLLFTFALIVSYFLGFFWRFQTLWTGILEERLENTKYKHLVEFSIRIGVNAMAYLLAVACPQLALIAALSGTAGILVEIALPSVMQLILTLITKERNCWLVVKNVLIIGISSAVFAMSVLRCVREIDKLYYK